MDSTQLSAPPAQHAGGTRKDIQHVPARTGTDGHAQGNGHDHDDWGEVRKPGRGWIILVTVLVIAALAALFATGFLPRAGQHKELDADAAEALNAPVPVNLVHAKRAAEVVDVAVPGTLRPWQEVSLFARTTGYLKKFYVDISNQVEAGQLMAEIDTPEINQELRQAQAVLLQMNAAVTKASTDRELAFSTWNRFKSLKGTSGVTQQELDEKQSALNAAESNVASAKANVAAAEASVQRLTELQQFEKVTAPFAGVVTGRAYDVGSLIIANPTATDVKPMYKLAENDVLRAFINVPQSSALQIRKNMEVKVTSRERPGRVFIGKVMGTTNYLDPANRSLLTEVKVPNVKEPGGEFALLPGMYVRVSFSINRTTPPLLIPAPALIANADGTQVAVVKNKTVHFEKVVLGQDYGSEVEVVEGLNGDEQIIGNPGERIVEGVAVQIPNDNPVQQPSPGAPPREKVAEVSK